LMSAITEKYNAIKEIRVKIPLITGMLWNPHAWINSRLATKARARRRHVILQNSRIINATKMKSGRVKKVIMV